MFYLIFYGIIIYLAIMAFVYIILPIGSVVALILSIVGTAIGVFYALKSYIKSIISNINPYDYYVDNSPKKEEFAERRSYFFGPGYKQLIKTAADAWKGIWAATKKFGGIRRAIIDWTDMFIVHQILWIAGWILWLCAIFSVGILGSLITCVLGAIHAVVLTVVMVVIYIIFSVTWLIDRIYLQKKAIKTSCPVDQYRAVIPMFACPNCGEMHQRLVPGPYGIWHRKCTCGEVLPTTFLMGRSSLEAYCPQCGSPLAASDVQQFALTIVGGTSSGKTVLLSSFYHELFQDMDNNKDLYYDIPEMHSDMFENLKNWFNGEKCEATQMGQTSDMYSILLKSGSFEVDKQFSLYDIAGEAFEDPEMSAMIPQKQMRDSDGVVIVIDPLSALEMREDAKSEGDDTSNFSSVEAATVITNFVTYLKAVLTNSKMKVKSQKPVSVVITKSDLSSISRRISYHKIKTIMHNNPGTFENFETARDEICREFLMDIGLMDAVRAIEAGFTEVHYFPVSAIGHAANGEEYEPEHVTEPFYWLIQRTDPVLANVMGINKDNANA